MEIGCAGVRPGRGAVMRRYAVFIFGSMLLSVSYIAPALAQSSIPFDWFWSAAGIRHSDISAAAKRKPAANARHQAGDRSEKNDDNDKPETENIFGFTAGTDVGDVGGKEVEVGSTLRFGKRDGSYTAASKQIEFGYTPFRNFHFGIGPHWPITIWPTSPSSTTETN